MITATFVVFIIVIGGILVGFMISINERKIRKRYSSNYTLSRRYQLTENAKSMQMLTRLMGFLVISTFVYGTLFYLNSTLSYSWKTRNISGIGLGFAEGLNTLVQTIYFLIGTRELRHHLLKALGKRFQLNRTSVINETPQMSARVVDVRGKVGIIEESLRNL
ncbi:unnamed protein product, partial [Mesorhabditis belari]|uniref:Uncharacterized protein n=1 Tax=Mesorhabditis belari TaxID=2138241 RepID=A0AAF3F1I9_9BILA